MSQIEFRKVRLPKNLKPTITQRLIRLGNVNDGGYVVDEESIVNSECIVSFGLNDDWSFESDIFNKFGKTSVVYDASVNQKFFIKSAIKLLIGGHFKLAFSMATKYYSYNRFFKINTHIQKHVGPFMDSHYTPPSDILRSYNKQNFFLKIDIEGDEYHLLDDILVNQDTCKGSVIEFHNASLNLDKIIAFYDNFDQHIVHINVNNYGNVTIENIPDIIEVTTSKFTNVKDQEIINSIQSYRNNPVGWYHEICYQEDK